MFVKQNGLTPLHLAAQDDRAGVAEVLLNHGAEIDGQTKVSGLILWCFHRLHNQQKQTDSFSGSLSTVLSVSVSIIHLSFLFF